MSSSQRQTPVPIVPKLQSPAIKKGTDELMQLVNSLLLARDSNKPVLVHAETQTEGREVEELKSKMSSLQDINFSLQERMSRMEREQEAKDRREQELLAKIAELTAENERLKQAQAVNHDFMLPTSGNDDIPMALSPRATYSEPVHSDDSPLQGFSESEFLSFTDADDAMHVDDEPEYSLDNGMFFDNAASDTPSDDSLFRSAPPTPVSVSSATHLPVTLDPSYSPISPSPAPLKLRIPVTVSFNSEYSDSSSDDSSSEDSDITQHPQFPTPAHGSPRSSPLGDLDSEWEDGDLPFPSRIFIPTMSYVRQIGLAVPPPRENENIIFYVNRPVSPATSEEDSSDSE